MYTSMERSSSFWAGFSDCTEEAITFLLESENISESDPIIQGLREHLRQKQMELGLTNDSNKNIPTSTTAIISGDSYCDDHHDISVSESMDMDMSLDRTDEGYNSSINITQSDISSDISFSTEEIITTQHVMPSPPSVSDINTTFMVTPATVPPSSHTTSIPAHTVTVDSFTPIMHTQILSPVQQPLQQQFISTPVTNSYHNHHHQNPESIFCDPFQDPVSLAILAQNNPEIASVAQKLYQLLSEECDDSLLCDEENIDDEDDEDDENIVEEESADDNGNINVSDCGTHQLNCYSECITITDSLPVSTQSQSHVSIAESTVTVGQSCDDKENFHPEIHENSNSNSSTSKIEQCLTENNGQNTVFRLSPQNH